MAITSTVVIVDFVAGASEMRHGRGPMEMWLGKAAIDMSILQQTVFTIPLRVL